MGFIGSGVYVYDKGRPKVELCLGCLIGNDYHKDYCDDIWQNIYWRFQLLIEWELKEVEDLWFKHLQYRSDKRGKLCL